MINQNPILVVVCSRMKKFLKICLLWEPSAQIYQICWETAWMMFSGESHEKEEAISGEFDHNSRDHIFSKTKKIRK